jgi:Fe-Mn family superoxide dismutase
MPFTLKPLPYAHDAVAPYVSAQTMELHHGKHLKAYVDKANELSEGTGLGDLPLEQAVLEAHKKGPGPLFNNVGQIYNHTIFWDSMKKDGGGNIPGALEKKITESFEGREGFNKKFVDTGLAQFGSGWVWLVVGQDGKLEVTKSPNGESPLLEGKKPLIGCDVWEHAYYLDYQNRRADYLKAFVENLINWDFALKNFEAADKAA